MTVFSLLEHFGYFPIVRIFQTDELVYEGDFYFALDFYGYLIKNWIVAPNGSIDIVVYGGSEL